MLYSLIVPTVRHHSHLDFLHHLNLHNASVCLSKEDCPSKNSTSFWLLNLQNLSPCCLDKISVISGTIISGTNFFVNRWCCFSLWLFIYNFCTLRLQKRIYPVVLLCDTIIKPCCEHLSLKMCSVKYGQNLIFSPYTSHHINFLCATKYDIKPIQYKEPIGRCDQMTIKAHEPRCAT